MLRLLKWMYELGEKHGWDRAVEAQRKGHHLITSKEGKEKRLMDEAIFSTLEKNARKTKGD